MILEFLRDMCCVFFKHDYSEPVFCYSISNTARYFTVEMYKLCYCRRCHHFELIHIERRDCYVRDPLSYAEEENEKLRKKGYVAIVEGYEKLLHVNGNHQEEGIS